MKRLAIVGGTLVDGSGAPPVRDATVLIENDRIVEVGARSALHVGENFKVIEATGKYIIPGLVNANVHLIDGFAIMLGKGIEYLARFEGRLHEVIEEAAQISLANGMTTVFDTWNAHGPVLYSRDRIASGEVPGARIFAAGNIVGMGGPFSSDFMPDARAHTTKTFADRIDALFDAGVGRRLAALPPNEVRAIVRDYLASGIDFLKFAISDHILKESMNPHLTFSSRIQRIIAEETRASGKPLVSHTTSLESLNDAIELGVDAMMHCTITAQVPISEELIHKMIEKRVWGEIQPVTQALQSLWESTGDLMTYYAGGIHQQNTTRLIQAGAPILMGTDAGCTDPDYLCDHQPAVLTDRPYTLGQDHFLWFRSMRELGMKPMDILLAATRNPAIAYKKDHLIGTVSPGKLADVLVLDADPLEDVENFRRIGTIIQSGQVIDRSTLPVKKIVTEYPRMEAHQRRGRFPPGDA